MMILRSAALTIALALPAAAQDVIRIETDKSVAEAMDALQAAVEGAGATVFARVDHGAGAMKVDMEIPDAQLLIFGNPALGTPAMQDDPLAGLYLPLKVLVYQDGEGQVRLAYEDPVEMLDDLEIPASAAYLGKMQGALRNLTTAAAGG